MFRVNVVEKNKTHVLCSKTFFFENHAVYEIMWKNTLKSGRPQITIWRMSNTCWIPKTANTLWIYTTYCFSTTTTVARMRLNYTLYLECLSCYFYWRSTELYLLVAKIFRNISPSVQEKVGKFKITQNPFFPFHRTVLVYYEERGFFFIHVRFQPGSDKQNHLPSFLIV